MPTHRIPLLRDYHSHPLLYAAFGKTVSLLDVTSKEEANSLLRAAAKQEAREIVVAHGWRSNFFDWTDEELRHLPPVAIFNVSLHSLKLNETGSAVIRARYGETVANVSNQDWYEENFRTVLNWFANLYASAEALTEFYDWLLAEHGIIEAEEMLLFDEREIDLFRETGLLTRTKIWSAPDTFQSLSASAQDEVFGLKLFTDGAIGAKTAAMSRSYIGSVDSLDLAQSSSTASNRKVFGKLMYSDAQLIEVISECLQTKKSLAIHAIGDIAIEQTIGVLEQNAHAVGTVPTVRIEHAQLIGKGMAERAKRLGVVLSMQPNFSSDSVDYRDRMDESFCEMNNPFRMLIDEVGFVPGEDLIFGSDGMPHGIRNALEQSLFPSLSSQRLTVEEFQAGYCVESEDRGYIEFEIDATSITDIKIVVKD